MIDRVKEDRVISHSVHLLAELFSYLIIGIGRDVADTQELRLACKLCISEFVYRDDSWELLVPVNSVYEEVNILKVVFAEL